MNPMLRLTRVTAAAIVSLATTAIAQVPTGPPHASIDLGTADGARLVQGTWRYASAKVVDVDFRAVGSDNKPSGAPNRTYDVVPHAGAADFDDSTWEVIDPTTLAARRSTGKVCFNWYRFAVTVPERIDNFDPSGSTLVFEVTVDDYAEVWVDGKLPRDLGQTGENLVAGWNAPNRLVLGSDVRPGQRFQIAVFGINGPISDAPSNYIWVRNAKLDFYQTPRALTPRTVPVEVVRRDPALDAIVPRDAKLEKLAEGFRFVEGPIWVGDGLLFSDPNANRIYKWTPDNRAVVWRERSGYQGTDVARYRQPGSNGLTLDAEGRLVIAEHGNRRISRLEKDGTQTILADRFDGKRFNSPNDVVLRSDGTIYFSDPPFGLPQFHADPGKELPYEGVFCLRKGKLTLVSRDFTGPNGLALSPDEKHLYVCNWDEKQKIVMRYEVRPDGSLANGKLFFDMTPAAGAEALDGLKVDTRGNVYVSGPGGLWILSAAGKHLGTIVGPELAANFAWGDADGRTLYMTARTGLYRMRLGVAGVRPEIALAPANAATFVRLDPRFDALVPRDAILEKLAGGFAWVEGPAWNEREQALYFSSIPENLVFRWRERRGVELAVERSGYTGSATFTGPEPGSNGLAFDAQGRLLLCQHGDRRIVRLETDGRRTVLADRYQGKRLNSPNDLVIAPDGALWFTDPPFGLPRTFDDPAKELAWSGVYRLAPDGTLTLATRELEAPNGLAFSPDGKTLYVSNANPKRALWMAYDVQSDGSLARGRVFFDATPFASEGPGSCDGMKVDGTGNLFATAPGGIWVLASDGTLLGKIVTGIKTANCAFSDDGATLYVTADQAIYRLRLRSSSVASR